jgi:SAM-dependent methyltransferase
METITPLGGLDDLKTRQRAMWGLGDYAKVADTVIPRLGRTLVEALAVAPGEDVLDVGAGVGNAALPAARRGANVTASDLSDSLLAQCAARAEAAGLQVRCVPADAERLVFGDASFDVVMSCLGVMFAPHHRAAADELLRVCRPGGRIGVVSWTPEGFIGRLFATMRPFVPAPPAGVQPPPLWGDPRHIHELFGSRLWELTCEKRSVHVDAFTDPTGFRELFKHSYGPTVAVYRELADDPARTAELDRALDELAASATRHGAMDWEYLLVTGRRH